MSTQDTPLQDFSHCHDGIVKKLDMLDELPDLLTAADRARDIAATALDFFREAMFAHHTDEERELFPAVLASAEAGDEATHVAALVQRLTDEHRALEALWAALERDLKQVAKGQTSRLQRTQVQALVRQYQAHAAFEEAEFLPLCQTILGRNSHHMAALGLSLHMRHTPVNVRSTYI